jgi:hypothetical protein
MELTEAERLEQYFKQVLPKFVSKETLKFVISVWTILKFKYPNLKHPIISPREGEDIVTFSWLTKDIETYLELEISTDDNVYFFFKNYPTNEVFSSSKDFQTLSEALSEGLDKGLEVFSK